MNQENLVNAVDKLADGLGEAMELAREWKRMAQYLVKNKAKMVEVVTSLFQRDDPLTLIDKEIVLENINSILDYLLEVAELNSSFKHVNDIPPKEKLRKNNKMSYKDIVYCLFLLKDSVDCDRTKEEYEAKILLTDCFDTLIEVFSD